jgi:hypothetical protein
LILPELRGCGLGFGASGFFLMALAEIDDHARVGVFAEEIPVLAWNFCMLAASRGKIR